MCTIECKNNDKSIYISPFLIQKILKYVTTLFSTRNWSLNLTVIFLNNIVCFIACCLACFVNTCCICYVLLASFDVANIFVITVSKNQQKLFVN